MQSGIITERNQWNFLLLVLFWSTAQVFVGSTPLWPNALTGKSVLSPVQVWSTTWFQTARKLMVLIFLNSWRGILPCNTWLYKICISLSISSFIRMKPCSFIYTLSGCFCIKWQLRSCDRLSGSKPKVFMIWPFTEKVYWPLHCDMVGKQALS